MNRGIIINNPGITQNITISGNADNIAAANKGPKTYSYKDVIKKKKEIRE